VIEGGAEKYSPQVPGTFDLLFFFLLRILLTAREVRKGYLLSPPRFPSFHYNEFSFFLTTFLP